MELLPGESDREVLKELEGGYIIDPLEVKIWESVNKKWCLLKVPGKGLFLTEDRFFSYSIIVYYHRLIGTFPGPYLGSEGPVWGSDRDFPKYVRKAIDQVILKGSF